ncbi:ATP phosphoribosyltransferase catalytic subunit [Heliophilum fasciatum]|uniref:ATP phosphoribosyltransferase n=2 Tax=Heliophilum fasciatum TaxID=35700 RepID=A0A4R2RNT5_9FIRM|nr:ATP phosphoribosyltransferase [Heliophilum fasciatum]TCP64359.1 ATP phosphoribosyltransferase catalytic subunit [Heliophilum fasciatum]
MKDTLTIALPKGKLYDEAIDLLAEAGLSTYGLKEDSRKLMFHHEAERLKYIICRPTDIPTFVEYGAADIGVVGKDTIVEQDKDIMELVDLKFGFCRFVVALPEEAARGRDLSQFNHRRVATKFPEVADAFFREKGMQVEIIKLHGNIELAPMVGLADMIVDIVSTGRTLRENNLVAVEEIFNATARLVANRVSYRLKHQRIQPLVEKVRQLVKDKEVRY